MAFRSRKTPRAQWYDYTSAGTYFITICTKNREHYFWEIHNEKMILNEIGDICNDEIQQTQEKRKYITIDQYCIMPNHVHMLVIIDEYSGCRDAHAVRPAENNVGRECRDAHAVRPLNINNRTCQEHVPTINKYKWPSLWQIINVYKWNVKKRCNDKNILFARQSRYHDHIVKNEDEYKYNKIKWYIINNPSNWKDDTFNR